MYKRVLKKFLGVCCLSLFVAVSMAAAKDESVPVLIRASAANVAGIEDGDFVSLFNDVVYNEIINKRAVLWDSYNKEIQISGVTLQEIERNGGMNFKDQKFIYIFENWKRTNQEIQTVTSGFMFTARNDKGEDISFGYVEYNNISGALQKTKLGVSADGYYNQSLSMLINTKRFAFDIIQFQGQPIRTNEEQEKIRNEYIGKLGFNTVLFSSAIPQKMVTYTIERSVQLNDEYAQNSSIFLDAFELYLINHPDKIAQFGNEELANTSVVDLKVNRIEIKELWIKEGDKINYSPQQLIIYLNETPMKAMTHAQVAALNVKFNGTDVFTYLRQKKYNFIINAINGQRIARVQSFFFLRALQEGDWQALNDYVKKM